MKQRLFKPEEKAGSYNEGVLAIQNNKILKCSKELGDLLRDNWEDLIDLGGESGETPNTHVFEEGITYSSEALKNDSATL